jgi:hypothetical protein
MPPPDTERYCLSCLEKTIWKYNKIVGHSRCTQCGGSFSTSHEVPEDAIEDIAVRLMPWVVNNSHDNKR